jgi:hypothetical protein
VIWRPEVAGGVAYEFGPDDAPLVAHRDWAIACAQLVDDVGGAPLAVPFRARVVLPGTAAERAQDGSWVRRTERAVTVKAGADGTFALVARPWLRVSPFVAPAGLTVRVDADGFLPLLHTFPIAYDQRFVVAPAPAAGSRTVTLGDTTNLVAGQVLLFGPPGLPQYVRIRSVGAGNVVTLAAGLVGNHAVGDVVFPDAFAAPAPVVLALRRAPVRIVGRVVARNTAANVATPVAGASITVTDFWRTRADVVADPAHGAMTDPNPALRQFAVALSPGALAERAVGAGVGTLALPPVVGDDRTLALPADGDATRLNVSRRQNLLPAPAPLANRLLLVDADDPDAAEFQSVATVQPAAGAPDEPARLGLELPLRRAHRAGARVSRVAAPALLPPAPQLLRAATAPGDRCAFVDGLGALPAAGTLRLTGGGPVVDEFQRFERLETLSGVDGEYALPPLHRMARVALTVDDGAGHVQVVELEPEYGEREQRLDVVYLV